MIATSTTDLSKRLEQSRVVPSDIIPRRIESPQISGESVVSDKWIVQTRTLGEDRVNCFTERRHRISP